MIYLSSRLLAKLRPHFQRSAVPRKHLFVPELHKSQNISNCWCQCAVDFSSLLGHAVQPPPSGAAVAVDLSAHAKRYRMEKRNVLRFLLTIITLKRWHNSKFIFIVCLKRYLVIPTILVKHAREYS